MRILYLLPFFASTLFGGPVDNMLGAIDWASATAGWGTVHRNQSIVGNPIRLNGHAYQTGIGTHANSDITYNVLGYACSFFQSDVGVDDEQGTTGTVLFQVFGDGDPLYSSPVMRGGSKHQQVRVQISNFKVVLVRVTDASDTNRYDHADWAGAKLVCEKKIPVGAVGGGRVAWPANWGRGLFSYAPVGWEIEGVR